MNTTRRALFGGAAALAGLALAGCQSKASNAITLGLTYIPNVQFAPFYVALDKGLFAERGLDIVLRHHGAQEDLFGAVLTGKEQVVVASSDEAMVAAASGQVLATFATMYQRYPVSIIVPKVAGATSIKALAGRRIGLPGRYGSSYYGLLAGLAGAGMSESDVQLTEIGYTGVAALLGGKVDAIVGFSNNEPLQFAAQGLAVDVLPVVDEASPNLVGPGLLVKPGTLPSDVLGKIAGAVLAAEKAIVADPTVGLDATAKQVPDLASASARANAEAVLAATVRLWLGADGAPSLAVSSAAFERMSALLASSKITATKVDPASVIVATS